MYHTNESIQPESGRYSLFTSGESAVDPDSGKRIPPLTEPDGGRGIPPFTRPSLEDVEGHVLDTARSFIEPTGGKHHPAFLRAGRSRLVALIGAAVMAVAMTAPASALVSVVKDGPYDLRPFVTVTHASQFVCSPGRVSIRPLVVYNPSETVATNVYALLNLYRWNGANFVVDNQIPNPSPMPDGVRLGAGRSFTVPGATFPVRPGTYYLVEEVDFRRNGNRVGAVLLKPDTEYDYVLTGQAKTATWPGHFPYCIVP